MINKIIFFICFLTIIIVHASLFYAMSMKKVTLLNQNSKVYKISLKTNFIKENTEAKRQISHNKYKKQEKSPKKIKKTVSKKSLKKIQKKDIKKNIIHKKQENNPKKVTKIKGKSPKKILKKAPKKKIVKKENKKITLTSKPKYKSNKPNKSNKIKGIEQKYLSKIQRKIEENKKYPRKAKLLKQQGVVIVSFDIMKNGLIKSLKLKSNSPFKRLNKAAIEIIKGLIQVDPIPKELNKNILHIDIPISFLLSNS